jgi:hypothetical protein
LKMSDDDLPVLKSVLLNNPINIVRKKPITKQLLQCRLTRLFYIIKHFCKLSFQSPAQGSVLYSSMLFSRIMCEYILDAPL